MTNFDRLPATIFQDNSEIGGLDSFPSLPPLDWIGTELGEPRNTSRDSFVHLSILHSESGAAWPKLEHGVAWRRWAWKSGFLSAPRAPINDDPSGDPSAAAAANCRPFRSTSGPDPTNNPRTGNERKTTTTTTTTTKQMDNAEAESALSTTSTSKISGRLSSD